MNTRAKPDDKKNKSEGDNRRPKRESSRSRQVKSYFEGEEYLKGVKSKNKSPARKRSTSRKKSPARDKSPVKDTNSVDTQRRSKRVHVSAPDKSGSPSWKSPARKSPSRRSPGRKSPSRISPARLRVEAEETKRTTTIPIHTSTPIVDVDTESDTDFKPVKTVKRRMSLLKMESTPVREVESQRGSATREFFVTKRSSVMSQERIVHLRNEVLTPQEKNLTEFSDDDSILPIQSKRIDSIESRTLYKPVFVAEFGGWFGAMFLILSLPVFGIGLLMVCNNQQCGYQLPDLAGYTNVTTFIDVFALLCFLAYFILLMLLSILPFGGKKVHGNLSKYGRTSYIANGWVSILVMHLILIGLELLGFEAVNYIYDNYFALSVAAMLHGVLFSVFLYVKSFFVPISALNPNGDTNSFVYNFFIGREINPVIWGVINVKILLLRLAFVSLTLITTVIVMKSLSLVSPLANLTMEHYELKNLNIDTTCLTLAVMWYIYFFDGVLVLEKVWSTTFEMQYEGMGYMSCFIYFSMPGLCGTMIKYVYDYNVKLNPWLLTVAFVQFLIGYVLYSGSNYQKNLFRNNPYSSSVAHLETIPTSQGKKLIVSGFWGFVRHPNYLGDIIIQLSFFYFVYNVPPGLICLMTIPLFMHRAKRDGFRCKQKYDSSWDRYCQRVRYMLVPKVY